MEGVAPWKWIRCLEVVVAESVIAQRAQSGAGAESAMESVHWPREMKMPEPEWHSSSWMNELVLE